MRAAIATTFAAALLAASSMAYAADNNNGDNNDGMKNDPATTGSITNNGRSVPLEDREFCIANPSDAKCQDLGGVTNQQ